MWKLSGDGLDGVDIGIVVAISVIAVIVFLVALLLFKERRKWEMDGNILPKPRPPLVVD